MKNISGMAQALLLGVLFGSFGLGACDDSGTDSGTDSADAGASSSGGGLNIATGGTNGSGGDAMGGADSCAESTASANLVPANLLFVVDKSGSMNCNAPPTDPTCAEPQKVDAAEASKWEITQEALTGPSGALQTLAGQAGISVGLIAFPLDDNCQVPGSGEVTVPIERLTSEHLDALQAGLSLSADGQTPLAGAAIRGLEAIRLGIHAGELEGDNYLVVMTDGAETCQEDALEDLLAYVADARTHYGIRTYAIGAPGSEASRSLLSELAVIGGTRRSDDCSEDPTHASESCHIDLTESDDFEADLGAEFRGITEATTQTCEYDVPKSAFVDRKKVNVEYTPSGGETELVPQDPGESGAAQCEGAEGWQFSEDGSQIVLCGQVCADVLADPEAKVRVVFGCKETVVR